MVKHIHFSTKLCILKHSVITVIKKRRKEPNYGQIYIIVNKRITTTKTNRTDHQIKAIKVKINTFLCIQEHTVLQPGQRVVAIIWDQVQGIKTTYTQHCLTRPVSSQLQSTRLQEELAAYSVGRSKLHHIYCRKKL